VLQCVAVCCSVLQCVAVCCSVLQCVAVCCSVLQCSTVLTYCSARIGPRTLLHRGEKRGQRGGTENKYQVSVHEFLLFFVQVYCHELYVRRHRGKMKNKTTP